MDLTRFSGRLFVGFPAIVLATVVFFGFLLSVPLKEWIFLLGTEPGTVASLFPLGAAYALVIFYIIDTESRGFRVSAVKLHVGLLGILSFVRGE